MNLYPAIDIKSGECVRLYQGRYDSVTVYEQNPLIQASKFKQDGATQLHVVDLDGAKQGKQVNFDIITKLAQQSGLKIQMGGGIRTRQQICDALNVGINRVILGSIAVSRTKDVKEWLCQFGGDKIVLALDIRFDSTHLPKLAIHGWQTSSETTLWQLLDEYQDTPLRHVLCTDISHDGTLQGPNISLYQECVKRYPSIEFQASGGVAELADLKALSAIPVAGVIVGKALYANKFTLKAAIEEASQC
jgi:phosphoribosylformimino-5-aminoimidazole carboxamide ribotide isomerase